MSEVLYERRGPTAVVTMNRPEYRNAQNSAMTYALDDAFTRAVEDSDVKVIVLAGAGNHFSAGHDIGSPGRDADVSFPRRAVTWWDHVDAPGADQRFARESEVYLGMCRRWRDLPKPTIAAVHGACIAGALMLAWTCDLIVASDDAFFADPVVRMGIPGVEYFAHPWVLGPRAAKEVLFTGARFSADQALTWGMVNRVVPRAALESEALSLAAQIAEMPRFGLALAKKAVNQAEDLMGLRNGMDSAFALHHLAHAHNAETTGDSLGGHNAHSMRHPTPPTPHAAPTPAADATSGATSPDPTNHSPASNTGPTFAVRPALAFTTSAFTSPDSTDHATNPGISSNTNPESAGHPTDHGTASNIGPDSSGLPPDHRPTAVANPTGQPTGRRSASKTSPEPPGPTTDRHPPAVTNPEPAAHPTDQRSASNTSPESSGPPRDHRPSGVTSPESAGSPTDHGAAGRTGPEPTGQPTGRRIPSNASAESADRATARRNSAGLGPEPTGGAAESGA